MSTRRSPDRRRGRRLCAAWGALVLTMLSGAATAADGDVRAERQRIANERAAVEQHYVEVQADCARRFIVTPCANEAKRQRRVATEALNRQTLAIDESERRRQAAARLRAIDAKAAAHAVRPAASATPSAVEPVLPALIPRGASTPAQAAADRRAATAEAAAAKQASARDAAARVVERNQRLADAEAHRAAVERRQRERRLSGRAAAPLPPVSAPRP